MTACLVGCPAWSGYEPRPGNYSISTAPAVPVHEWAVCGAMNAGFAALNANSALPFILNRDIQVGGCISGLLNTSLAHSTSQAIQ
jgi:hypothetical protein